MGFSADRGAVAGKTGPGSRASGHELKMVTIDKILRIDSNIWQVQYSSSLEDATFYIYIDGIEVAITQLTQYNLPVAFGENSIIEILDDPDELPAEVFPGKVVLGWSFVEAADHYSIEEYVGGNWLEVARVQDNGGYMSWQSRLLKDGQVHLFRIIPVAANDNEGTPREFAVLTVRHPDVPDVNYSYSQETKQLILTG